MKERHIRTNILIGEDRLQHLANQHVLIAGLGGVGGYVAENLARAGVGELSLLDSDTLVESNLNRQLIATTDTIGQLKTDMMQARIHLIDPSITVNKIPLFLNQDNAHDFLQDKGFSFVADCIDTIACKAALVQAAQSLNMPVISALGAGNKLDPKKVKIVSLKETSNCGLARNLRKRLRELNASLNYPVVYSTELGQKPLAKAVNADGSYDEKATNGTISYLPALFGVLLAGELIKQLLDAFDRGD